MTESKAAHDALCVNTIRALSMDMVQGANSGHPGAPMGLAPAAYVLWTRHLKHDPSEPHWADRDRFVLSAGHASALLYSLLHLTGYDLDLEDLKGFRQWGSRTPGHPEFGMTPGVETTTGPLGQGIATAVGMAMAEKMLASRFNAAGHRVVDHRVWGICSDGDLMEGISHEAASLAGHLKLGNLNFIYDNNHITIDGRTDISFSEDVAKRFESYGWHTLHVDDGTDLEAIASALSACAAETSRPSLVLVRTHIAEGAPTKEDTSGAHGAPLGVDEIAAWRSSVGWPDEDYHVPEEALAVFRSCIDRGSAAHAEWAERFTDWAKAEPELATEWDRRISGRLPALDLPVIEGEKLATRKATAKTLAALAQQMPELAGGSADLAESNGAALGTEAAFSADAPGRYIHWGVREHAMGAAVNGITLHGGMRAYSATFLIFSDYMRPAIRLASLMEIPSVFLFSHDSVALGEDGPTHQPIEQLMSLRAIPGLNVIRPADANETVEAWRAALQRLDGPTLVVVTRQDLPIVDRSVMAGADGLHRGAYTLIEYGPEKPAPEVILIATGSEVSVAVTAAEALGARGIRTRVVSMPGWELFAQQP
ncbi:MAG: transketolase, partial [Actinobacteria bacterium]|nr:transketolase [Actinomycetota bacterium]